MQTIFEYIEEKDIDFPLGYNAIDVYNRAEKAVLPNGKDFWCEKVDFSECNLTSSDRDFNFYYDEEDGGEDDLRYMEENILCTIEDEKYEDKECKSLFIDQFIKANKIKNEDILNPKLPNNKSTIKEIQKHFDNINKKYVTSNKRVQKDFTDSLTDYYKENGIDEGLFISISTDPRLFAKLGHYGCDQNSCFAGGNKCYKFVLPAYDYAVVILGTKVKATLNDVVNDNIDINARCYGFLNKNNLVTSNHYIKGIRSRTFPQSILAVVRKYYNPKAVISDAFKYKNNSGIYSNDDGLLFGNREYVLSINNKNQSFVENLNRDGGW